MPSKTLINGFRCVLLGLELNFAVQWPSTSRTGHPLSKHNKDNAVHVYQALWKGQKQVDCEVSREILGT